MERLKSLFNINLSKDGNMAVLPDGTRLYKSNCKSCGKDMGMTRRYDSLYCSEQCKRPPFEGPYNVEPFKFKYMVTIDKIEKIGNWLVSFFIVLAQGLGIVVYNYLFLWPQADLLSGFYSGEFSKMEAFLLLSLGSTLGIISTYMEVKLRDNHIRGRNGEDLDPVEKRVLRTMYATIGIVWLSVLILYTWGMLKAPVWDWFKFFKFLIFFIIGICLDFFLGQTTSLTTRRNMANTPSQTNTNQRPGSSPPSEPPVTEYTYLVKRGDNTTDNDLIKLSESAAKDDRNMLKLEDSDLYELERSGEVKKELRAGRQAIDTMRTVANRYKLKLEFRPKN